MSKIIFLRRIYGMRLLEKQ